MSALRKVVMKQLLTSGWKQATRRSSTVIGGSKNKFVLDRKNRFSCNPKLCYARCMKYNEGN